MSTTLLQGEGPPHNKCDHAIRGPMTRDRNPLQAWYALNHCHVKGIKINGLVLRSLEYGAICFLSDKSTIETLYI